MFSAVQESFLKSLIHTMKEKGYPYYLVHTSRRDDSNQPDLYVYFSKEDIKGNGLYSYTISNGVRYAVNSSNYSDRYQAQRISVGGIGSKVVVVPSYEHVYTNADFGIDSVSVQPDITLQEGGELRAAQTDNFLLLVLLLTVVMLFIFRWRR